METDPDLPELSPEVLEYPVEEATGRSPGSRVTRTLVRLGLGLGMLGLLIWQLPDVTVSDIIPTFTWSAAGWILLAVALHIVAYVFQTLRWQVVSTTIGIHLPFRRMWSHLLAGEFVSKSLPTSFGGDVLRILRQGRDCNNHARAFAGTTLERLTGWIVLPLISMTALLLHPSFFDNGVTVVAVLINIGTLVALSTLLWIGGHPKLAGRISKESGWKRFVGAIHLGIRSFHTERKRAVLVIGVGLAFQILQCLSVLAIARGLELPLSIWAIFAFFPPVAIAQNVPFSLSGLGVREAAFVLFFTPLGITDAQAVGFGLLVYIVFVVSSLAGAPSFVFGKDRQTTSSSSPRDIAPGTPPSATNS